MEVKVQDNQIENAIKTLKRQLARDLEGIEEKKVLRETFREKEKKAAGGEEEKTASSSPVFKIKSSSSFFLIDSQEN